jgi:hypothetical protein
VAVSRFASRQSLSQRTQDQISLFLHSALPQGLKPPVLTLTYGTAKAVPSRSALPIVFDSSSAQKPAGNVAGRSNSELKVLMPGFVSTGSPTMIPEAVCFAAFSQRSRAA